MMSSQAAETDFLPSSPRSVEETGLNLSFLSDLALKIMYLHGDVVAYGLAENMKLPYAGVVKELVTVLRSDQLCEVKGTAKGTSQGLGSAAYRYALTDKGRTVARESLDRCQYAGPAPVPLKRYNAAVQQQSLNQVQINRHDLEQAFSHLVLDEQTRDCLGAAINSHASIFLFGPPGDGKTAISVAMGQLLLKDTLYIPYAVETGNEVIKLFNAVNHVRAPEGNQRRNGQDLRWVHIHRPTLSAGGELTLSELDLTYERSTKFYEAPLQMKANGGMLLIDDFGRQQARPRDLLNRWIVPLEQRTDYLTLHTGRKIEIPFDALIVFATNLAPRDLVDEAFLRRIRHKIRIGDPAWEEFRQILRQECRAQGVPYSEEALAYLIKEHYVKTGRPRRRCHPRDLVAQLKDIASYIGVAPELRPDLLDRACQSYFVDL